MTSLGKNSLQLGSRFSAIKAEPVAREIGNWNFSKKTL